MTASTASLLDVVELGAGGLRAVLDLARRPVAELGRPLDGQGVALVFEKPSNRTRQSSEIAVVQLGGHPVYTRGDEIGFDTREPVEDVARIMSGYHSVIAARVMDHRTLERLDAAASVPVVNLLSDHSHPLQAIADALTMEAHLGDLAGLVVARSLAEASLLLGAEMRIASPAGYGPSEPELARLGELGSVVTGADATDLVAGAHAVHTDTWVSMGQEDDTTARRADFAGFTVDAGMMALAAPGAVFLHCLPAYRGLEVAAEVIDGPQSVVIEQGHRRLDAARAVLARCAGVGGDPGSRPFTSEAR